MPRSNWSGYSFASRCHSVLPLTGMVAILALLGWLIAGTEGIAWTGVIALLVLLVSPRVSPRAILSMYGAHPLTASQAPGMHALVGELALRARLPVAPLLYHVPSPSMNAFAIGHPKDAVLALTDGLVHGLTQRELAGVLAHEVSHIRGHDTRVMSIADVVGRLTTMLALSAQVVVLADLPVILFAEGRTPALPVLLLLAPLLSGLLQLGLSRNREFDADRSAAALTGDPAALIAALSKLEHGQPERWQRFFARRRRAPGPSMLRTHPTTEERIRRLRDVIGRTTAGVLSLPDCGAAGSTGRMPSGPVPGGQQAGIHFSHSRAATSPTAGGEPQA